MEGAFERNGRRGLLRSLAVLAIAAGPTIAYSQCETGWLPGLPGPSLNGSIDAMAVYDADGPGPLPQRLWIGGSFVEIDTLPIATVNLAYTDGEGWVVPPHPFLGPVTALAFYNGELVAAGSGGSRLVRFDGTGWQRLDSANSTGSQPTGVKAMVVHNGELILCGTFGQVASVSGTAGLARWTGSTWAALGTGLPTGARVNAILSTPQGLVAVGDFEMIGGVTAHNAALWTGTAWTALPGLPAGPGVPNCLVVHQGSIYAGHGDDVAGVVWRWTGLQWESIAPQSELSGPVAELVSLDDQLIAIGGESIRVGTGNFVSVARWDGTAWANLEDSGQVLPQREDFAPAVRFQGRAFFGGTPTYRKDSEFRVAPLTWNQTEHWRTHAKGLDDVVLAITEFEGEVLIGGAFKMAGGRRCSGVARFDGANFHPVGDGLINPPLTNEPGWVNDFEVFQGQLHASGTGFRVSRGPMARWDGTAWRPTSTTYLFGGPHRDLCSHQGELYVVRDNSSVLRLDGGDWVSISIPIEPFRFTLASFAGHAFAGGSSTLRRWDDDQTWSVIQPGAATFRLTVLDGNMYALRHMEGFGPQIPGETLRSAIGVWDGTVMRPVGSGWLEAQSNNSAGGLVKYHGDLIASKSFSKTGAGLLARTIRFNGIEWMPVPGDVAGGAGSQLSPMGLCAAAIGDTVYIGGAFTNAGGAPSARLARYRSSPAPTFDTVPQPTVSRPGRDVTFTATIQTQGQITQRWRRNGELLVEGAALPGGGVATGVTSGTLTISNCGLADAGGIDCLITNPCGTSFSPPVALDVFCHADLDSDGTIDQATPDGAVTIDDLLFFLAGFEGGDSRVDVDDDGNPAAGNPDGGVTIDDLLFFLARFELGC